MQEASSPGPRWRRPVAATLAGSSHRIDCARAWQQLHPARGWRAAVKQGRPAGPMGARHPGFPGRQRIARTATPHSATWAARPADTAAGRGDRSSRPTGGPAANRACSLPQKEAVRRRAASACRTAGTLELPGDSCDRSVGKETRSFSLSHQPRIQAPGAPPSIPVIACRPHVGTSSRCVRVVGKCTIHDRTWQL
jgi:hypothetical protein